MGGALSGQVAWVTGGGSGIGLAGAIELARAGAQVVISGRDAAKLQAAVVQATLQGAPAGTVSAMALDVADRAAVACVGAEIAQRLGRIDILVNSAGLNVRQRAWDVSDAASFEHVTQVNLVGAAACTYAVLPGMRARGQGTVINVASFAGWYVTALTGPAYTASKAGLMALTAAFNVENAHHGLRATALCPGEVATPIMKQRPVEPSDADKARMLQEADLGRTIGFIATMPAHVCINELVISPVWNRIYVGGAEFGQRG